MSLGYNAPINVKPAGGWGGGSQGIGWGFDCLCWPWGREYLNLSLPALGII